MQFHALVEEVRLLSLPEKEEIRSLLDKLLAQERRARIAASHRESLAELERGELEFTSDVDRLRSELED